MSKKIKILVIIPLLILGFLIFSLKKTGMIEAQGAPAAAMKTRVDGDFYVPDLNPQSLKVVFLFDNPNLEGDQTGPTGEPNASVDMIDLNFMSKHFGSIEEGPNWDYMADIEADRKVDMLDLGISSKNFGKSGSYIYDLTGVSINFDTGDTCSLNGTNTCNIPAGAKEFWVKQGVNPIGAYLLFYAGAAPPPPPPPPPPICTNLSCQGSQASCSCGTAVTTAANPWCCAASNNIYSSQANCQADAACAAPPPPPVCISDNCNGNCPVNCGGADDPDCSGQCLDCTCATDNDCASSCAAGDGCCPGCVPADPDCAACVPGTCDTVNRKYCNAGAWTPQDDPLYCSSCTHCVDLVSNCSETGIDCGGGGCPACAAPGPPAPALSIPLPNFLACDSIEECIEMIINFIFWIAVAIVPIMIIVAGFFFLTAGGDPERVRTAKKIFFWTVVGFAIILFARGIISAVRRVLED